MNVAAAILIYNDKILGFKRKPSKNKYTSCKYEFPGGKVKKNEKIQDTLRREIKEELDLDLGKTTFFFQNDYTYPEFSVSLHFYISRLNKLNFSLKEHIEFKTLEVKDLRTVDWLLADYPVINYIEGNTSLLKELI